MGSLSVHRHTFPVSAKAKPRKAWAKCAHFCLPALLLLRVTILCEPRHAPAASAQKSSLRKSGHLESNQGHLIYSQLL